MQVKKTHSVGTLEKCVFDPSDSKILFNCGLSQTQRLASMGALWIALNSAERSMDCVKLSRTLYGLRSRYNIRIAFALIIPNSRFLEVSTFYFLEKIITLFSYLM
ncbi:hypothetical protein L9Z17_01760 [Leptospira noguchii]|nr:hypothetical protein [Leptospira noguchii]